MPIIKCKMCGGDLELIEGSSVCECEYCGTKQTVPTADNDKKLTLFARANRLRAANEFDKAAGVYENLVADFPEEAEAYWGLVLCRYGIEYVDDPATGKKIPTCHRSSFDSILEDEDFEQACENADAIARRVYREEAKAIEDIRRGILEISGKEEPYDIFICYKETDDNGDRTIDSVLAQDVYDALTAKGYRVFFSRISLEDKLGTEYEPYIFAALNSAKIMLVFGTDYEYFNAVWVKNEWSRFLAMMARGEKKALIPCYKDVDAYDMPKEFRRLQAQDMGKVGAVQDLMRGVEKILGPQEKQQAEVQPQTIVQTTGPNADSLLRRGELALEDRNWDDAKSFFNRVLDMVPESAEAYLGLAMAGTNCRNRADFRIAYTKADCGWRKSSNIIRVRQFGNQELLSWFNQLDEMARANDEAARLARKKAEEEKRIAREKAKEDARIAKEQKERIFQAEIEKRHFWREKCELAFRMIAIGKYDVLALKADGTVLSNGPAAGWSGITAVFAHTPNFARSDWQFGIKYDGSVVTAGINVDFSDWTDIVDLAICDNHIVGLKSDGKVVMRIVKKTTSVSTGVFWGDIVSKKVNVDFENLVSTWTRITAITTSNNIVAGLKDNGTVVAEGFYPFDPGSVYDWSDIIEIVTSDDHLHGIRSDGTGVSTKFDLSHWHDIETFTKGFPVAGIKSDGTILQLNIVNRKYFAESYSDIAFCCDGFGILSDGSLLPAMGKDYVIMSAWNKMISIHSNEKRVVGVSSDGMIHAFSIGPEANQICSRISGLRLFKNIDTIEEERTEYLNNLIAKMTAERVELQKELSNLKGMFVGKRKKEIQSRLDEIDAELKSLSQQ